MGKVVTLEELEAIIEKRRTLTVIPMGERPGGRPIVVTTCGAFDIIHAGHVRLFETMARIGDIVIVLLNSDSSIRSYKSEFRPIVPGDQRAAVFAGMAWVDYVVFFDEDSPIAVLDAIKPDIHLKGGEYKFSDLIELPTVEKNGGFCLLSSPLIDSGGMKFSTSWIIEKAAWVYEKEKQVGNGT